MRRRTLAFGMKAAMLFAAAADAPRAGSDHATAATNAFNDPFVQVTSAVPGCPVPGGPAYSPEEARSQSHLRIEKGTTCFQHGRCRLPNAYMYDHEIIPRVARFIQLDERFGHSSIWLTGQRRWVYLQGCVESRALADELVREVRLIDDVEAVMDELMVGVGGKPPYALKGSRQ